MRFVYSVRHAGQDVASREHASDPRNSYRTTCPQTRVALGDAPQGDFTCHPQVELSLCQRFCVAIVRGAFVQEVAGSVAANLARRHTGGYVASNPWTIGTTGVALAATQVEQWGAMPEMEVGTVGVGAGTRDTTGRSNVVRLVLSA